MSVRVLARLFRRRFLEYLNFNMPNAESSSATAAPDRAHGVAGAGDGTPETCGAPAGLGYGTTLPLVQNVAVTAWLEFIVTAQLPDPVQAPLQPPKFQPLGVAVSVTGVPIAKLALQVEPQLIPDGELVTRPPGLPMIETDRVEPRPVS